MLSMMKFNGHSLLDPETCDLYRMPMHLLGRIERAMRITILLIALWVFPGYNFAAQNAPGSIPSTVSMYRPLSVSKSGKVGFTLLNTFDMGIGFSNTISASLTITNQALLDGSGVAAGDVDGDGLCDLYFCAIDGSNCLYRNLGGWKFQWIPPTGGLECTGLRSTGCSLVDLDGDGDLDLVVITAGNGTHIFYNNGRGNFTHCPTVLNPDRGSKSLAFADIDGDGFLDIYIVNYRKATLMDALDSRFTFKQVDGKQVVATYNGRPTTDPDLVDRFTIGPMGDFQENGEPDALYRSQSGTNFVLVSFTDGDFMDEDGKPLNGPPRDWGLAAMFRDINGDHLPDLYVCNDFQTPDRFWINQGGGRFRLIPRLAQRHSCISSMSIDFADINRDGFDDFIVMDMMSRRHVDRMRLLSVNYAPIPPLGYWEDRPQYELNMLFLNQKDNTFAEIAQLSGVEASEWSWSAIFLDVDFDGWEDLLVSTGMERDGRDLDVATQFKVLRMGRKPSNSEILALRAAYPKHADGTMAFRNRGDLTFEEISRSWGFDGKGVCSAMALADLDGDGDLDVIVNSLNGPIMIYRNDSAAPRIAVKLKGQPGNTRGIGARISVSGGAVAVQSQEMIAGGRYLSCDDAMRTFAAGQTNALLTIEVFWRSGQYSAVSNALPNHLYEIGEPFGFSNSIAYNKSTSFQPPLQRTQSLFADVSDRLGHIHKDARVDDFANQPLLPNKLSQLGPGITWFDIDGDSRDDLIIAGGIGGALACYRNLPNNQFQQIDNIVVKPPQPCDQTTVIGWIPADQQRQILVGMANHDARSALVGVLEYDLRTHASSRVIATQNANIGPMALTQLNDSNMVLFVGGRVTPGRYPEPSSSHLYRYRERHWELDEDNTRLLNQVGLVSAAIFTDLNTDGYPELVLACEWGPIRIYRNNKGKLTPWDFALEWSESTPTPPSATMLSKLVGWWNGIAAGDFDGDGRLDLVAANWGCNTKYEAHRISPLSIYYGDLVGDTGVQTLEAYYAPELGKTVPIRSLNSLAKGLPWLRGQFESYQEFSTASIENVFGERLSVAHVLQANWLDSTLFLNRGDRFEVRPLVVNAQFSPAFGICTGDFNCDGREDLFLAQNFFGVNSETARYDAGRGLLLVGDGHGNFKALSGEESGIKIYGEQRGAAICDFDGDGKLDLVVTQNSGSTKLYRNQSAEEGLRIELQGTSPNMTAIGAVIRVKASGQWGPARELRVGGGYWSQDSLIQVFGQRTTATEVQVLWPGGRMTTSPIPFNAKSILINSKGTVIQR